MYLSRLFLNPTSWHVRRDLANCHEMHRSILSAFPDNIDGRVRSNYNILYRISFSPRHRNLELLVQSAIKPDWSALPGAYLSYSQNRSNPEVKDISNVLTILKKDLVVKFRLMANPTKKVEGRRVPIYGYDDRLDWLERKGNQHGFNLIQVKIHKDEIFEKYANNFNRLNLKLNDESAVKDVITHKSMMIIGWKRKKKISAKSKTTKRQLTFVGVIFDGYLRISKKDKFIESLNKGIGSAKSYGFGLMSIAPS